MNTTDVLVSSQAQSQRQATRRRGGRPGADCVANLNNACNDGTNRGDPAYPDLTGLAAGFAQILAGCQTSARSP